MRIKSIDAKEIIRMKQQIEPIVIPLDAPLREAAHSDTKCRDCKYICNDCSQVHYHREVWNGDWVVLSCDGYEKQEE